MERLQITEKGETGKIIIMFGVEELNNIEEDKGNKVKVLSSEIIVAISDKPEGKKFKLTLDYSTAEPLPVSWAITLQVCIN